MKTTTIALAAILFSYGAAADQITDSAIKESSQFIQAKPVMESHLSTAKGVVDAWERAVGLSKMLWLRHDSNLPLSWIQQVNKRVMTLRQVSYDDNASLEEQQLAAMVKLYATHADLFMMGEMKYSNFMYTKDYLVSYGQPLAEKLRGKPYKKNTCKWSDDNCSPPPPVWAQK